MGKECKHQNIHEIFQKLYVISIFFFNKMTKNAGQIDYDISIISTGLLLGSKEIESLGNGHVVFNHFNIRKYGI